jgi:hypothetical protein
MHSVSAASAISREGYERRGRKRTTMVRILFEDLIGSLSTLRESLVFILGQEISEEFPFLWGEDSWWHLLLCATLADARGGLGGYISGSKKKAVAFASR